MTSRKRSKNGGDSGTGVYIREETTSRVTAADRPYGKFYDFYSVSLETFGLTLVQSMAALNTVRCGCLKTLNKDYCEDKHSVHRVTYVSTIYCATFHYH
jgi:hypothetical protein